MRVDVKQLSPQLRSVFEFARYYRVTDFYLKEGSIPFFSIAGVSGKAPYFAEKFMEEGFKGSKGDRGDRSFKMDRELLSPTIRGMLMDFLNLCGVDYNKKKEEDFSVEVSSEGKTFGRYRVNYATVTGRIVLSFRRLFSVIPDIDTLNLPQILKEVKDYSTGLVIVTGPTGSGKSTTLASVINYLTEDTEKSRVIVTIEKPIEYVFPDKNTFIMQREVGKDTDSFVSGVYNALRQKPNVIYVGEARTREEIKAVLTASETGHLTLTTLHTSDAVSTISRIVDVFPPEEQPAVLVGLSEELRLIISQRLVPCLDGVPRAVCEVLKVTPDMRHLIKNRELTKLREAMKDNKNPSTLLDDELYKMCKVFKLIDEKTAVRFSLNPEEMRRRLES